MIRTEDNRGTTQVWGQKQERQDGLEMCRGEMVGICGEGC